MFLFSPQDKAQSAAFLTPNATPSSLSFPHWGFLSFSQAVSLMLLRLSMAYLPSENQCAWKIQPRYQDLQEPSLPLLPFVLYTPQSSTLIAWCCACSSLICLFHKLLTSSSGWKFCFIFLLIHIYEIYLLSKWVGYSEWNLTLPADGQNWRQT
jgi:hypothetical protein